MNSTFLSILPVKFLLGWLAAFRGYALLTCLFLACAAAALPFLAGRRFPEYADVVRNVAVPLGVGALGVAAVLAARRRLAAPAFLALAAVLAATEVSAAVALFPAIDGRKTGRSFYARIAPRFAHGEPPAYYGEPYRCYPILVMRRKTAHPRTEEELVAWLAAEPKGEVLVTEEHWNKWRDPALAGLGGGDAEGAKVPARQDAQALKTLVRAQRAGDTSDAGVASPNIFDGDVVLANLK